MPFTTCPPILQEFNLGCGDAQGGVRKFYVTEHSNIASYTEASGVLTAFTLNDGKKFWLIEQELEVAHAEEAPNPNRQNGTISYDQSIFMRFYKRSASLSYYLRALATRKLCFITVEMTGTIFVQGLENGIRLVPSTSPTGTTINDVNGYDLTFAGKEAIPAPTISQAILDTLVV